jgi:hypothetical protein
MSGLTKIGIAWLGIVALLGAAPCAAERSLVLPDGPFIEDMSRAIVPPPPPPIGASAAPEITPTLRAMYGQWRLVRRDDGLVPKKARFDFVLWGTMFLAQKGCLQASGQLIVQADGSVRIDRYAGTPMTSCKVTRIGPVIAPFDGQAARFDVRGDDLFVEVSGRRTQFRRVITDTGRASDDFMRGEWLLATLDGNPLRGTEKTSLSFDHRGSTIDAAHCDYWSDGAYPAESYLIRLGGSQSMVTTDCRASTIGDKWANAPDAYELIAVPVEARMDLRRRGKRVATLVPAARFPELADSARAIATDAWSKALAEHMKRLPSDQKLPIIGRILATDVSALGAGGAIPSTLEAQVLAAPVLVIAQLGGTPAVDRGDGLSLDYLYRVKESWRGDRKPGDVLIVRMPSLVGKSHSPFITPAIGTPVLLQASRNGYLVGRLLDGQPPSSDRRVVGMTLPIMRVEAGRLALDTPSPDIPGAQAWRGLTLDEAKLRVLAVDAQSKSAATSRSDAIRRYFIITIDGTPLPDPTWLWFDFDHDKPVTLRNRSSGAIIAWSDGCNVANFGNGWWVSTDMGCGQEKILPAMQELIGVIERDGVPVHMVLTSGGGSEGEMGPYSVPDIKTEKYRFELREGLR